jgi:hypothetical protein
VIKTAAIFPDHAARNSGPVMQAIRAALTKHNIVQLDNSMDADAAIIWSVLWHGRMAANREIYRHYKDTNRACVIVDIGTLARGVTWKIALDNINADGWYGHKQDLDPDRPERLGVRLTKAKGHEILIALQHQHSLQFEKLDCITWLSQQIREIRQHSDRPIVIRPHPRDPMKWPSLPFNISVLRPRAIAGTYDSFDWTNDWHAVVNHNSGPGILAGIAGVRPIVDRSSLAWPIATAKDAIEKSYDIDRDQWLIEIAHTEYTLDEINEGLWLKRLGSRL